MTNRNLVALDLFAGAGGWDLAASRHGITAHGVENMPAARATRDAAGLSTIFADVWDGLSAPHAIPTHTVQFASPPCQTFSMAGAGTGRAALDDVLQAIDNGAYWFPWTMTALAAETDPRTALVLTPLSYAITHRPEYIAWEQVPTVLPVWEACADVLRAEGYSVATGILNAEQYGVPQTRRRAILVARRTGVASLPLPTHSRYYSRDPERLDPGVLPWISMASGIGYGMAERPAPTITGGGTETGGAEPIAKLARYTARDDWGPRTAPPLDSRAWGFLQRPAVTVGNAVGRGLIGGSGAKKAVTDAIDAGTFTPSQGDGTNYAEATRITVAEAAALQTFPRDYPFQGAKTSQFLQIGNAIPVALADAIIATLIAD